MDKQTAINNIDVSTGGNLLSGILYEGKYKIVLINNQKLVVFENGTIYRVNKKGNLKIIKNVGNSHGYNAIGCNGKIVLRHRIIGTAFLGLELDDVEQIIDHIDMDKLNNNLKNLRILTQQKNLFNTNAKGYSFHKRAKKYQAKIHLNGKAIQLGYFKNESDARQAYLKAKLIYHVI